MKLIKVAAAVLNQTPRDWKGNKARIIEALKLAKQQNVTVLCLPEMTLTGYGMEDDYFCGDVPRRALLKLNDLISSAVFDNMIVCVGLPIRFNNTLYNSVATIVNGKVAGFTCKQHLAGDGIHYENRWFKPWPQGVVQTITIPELTEIDECWDGGVVETIPSFPIGDIHFNIGGVKFGYEICEDAWVAGRPGTILATKGVDVYLNPSASHFSFGKLETRKNFVVEGSRAFNATYIYSNLNGNEAGRAIYDGGALIASGGKLLAAGPRFSFKDVTLTTTIVDVDATRTQNVRTASFMPNTEKYNVGCVRVNFNYPKVTEKPEPLVQEDWEKSPDLKNEECRRAIGLALMDYMRKSKTKGFAVSLSGGADSAMVTYLCAEGIRMGVEELGVSEFTKKYCPHLQCITSIAWLNRKLITTAYQATEQSGNITKNAAEKLANALYVRHFTFDVQPTMNEYLKLAEQVKGSQLNFDDDALVLKNLQARVRAPSIWVIANAEGKLLLTTSNMSEAAVGYATMDGDTAGCVAPIAGLPKFYIKEHFLPWVEKNGCPAMKYINEQEPIAELMPKKYGETDEKDLMPYWLLHKIETLVVKNRYVPTEIFEELKGINGYDNDQLILDIAKFFRLFSINQWKRERYALSFHLDDHNLDPRTWCRTPILTGGYEEELEELMELLSPKAKEDLKK
jgi:NAD+ synthase (glutamine-hydrolysing)